VIVYHFFLSQAVPAINRSMVGHTGVNHMLKFSSPTSSCALWWCCQ